MHLDEADAGRVNAVASAVLDGRDVVVAAGPGGIAVQILDVSGDPGAGVVTARLTTLETDGSTKFFEGTYTVKNGVIAEFNVHQVS